MATVKHADRNAADRKRASPTERDVLQLETCQPTMIRAPADIIESPNFPGVATCSPRTIAAITATNSGMQPGLSAPWSLAGAMVSPPAPPPTSGAPHPGAITAPPSR